MVRGNGFILKERSFGLDLEKVFYNNGGETMEQVAWVIEDALNVLGDIQVRLDRDLGTVT